MSRHNKEEGIELFLPKLGSFFDQLVYGKDEASFLEKKVATNSQNKDKWNEKRRP